MLTRGVVKKVLSFFKLRLRNRIVNLIPQSRCFQSETASVGWMLKEPGPQCKNLPNVTFTISKKKIGFELAEFLPM